MKSRVVGKHTQERAYQEMSNKHVCNPRATSMYGVETYQCGCGRYFGDDDALDQQSVYRQHIIEEFKQEE